MEQQRARLGMERETTATMRARTPETPDRAGLLTQAQVVDKLVEQKPLLRLSVFLIALLAYSTASVPAMSYEEPEYYIVKNTDVYEVRQYKKRTVVEVIYGEEDSGF